MKISKLTSKQKEEFVEEFLRFRSKEYLAECINADIELSSAFQWALTSQGHEYWRNINDGEQPQETTQCSKALEMIKDIEQRSKVFEMTKEAERRGFGLGVWTKFGQIVSDHEHELLSNGDFYYRNIKVFKKGKWIKAGQMPSEKTVEKQERHKKMFGDLLMVLQALQSIKTK